jgi:hypothetical protein
MPLLPASPPEILDARRPFEQAQRFLDGAILRSVTDFYTCGWYGTTLHPDLGCYGIVQAEGDLADLVGDRVRVIYNRRSVIVYVFASYDIPYDIAITRRAYAALELLSEEELSVRFEVLTG